LCRQLFVAEEREREEWRCSGESAVLQGDGYASQQVRRGSTQEHHEEGSAVRLEVWSRQPEIRVANHNLVTNEISQSAAESE